MRRSRIKISGAGAVYHLIARIVGGERLLGDVEKERLRRMMWKQADFCGMEVITYCLMSNHIHILVRCPDQSGIDEEEIEARMCRFHGRREQWVQFAVEHRKQHGCLPAQVKRQLLARMGDISVFMKELKQRFTLWYNANNKRFGTLWAERFKSVLVEDSPAAARAVAMYVDLNPVRAGLVQDPANYRFCGYAEAVVGHSPIRRQICGLLGESSWRKAGPSYRMEFFVQAAGVNDPKKIVLTKEIVLRRLQEGGEISLAELLRLRIRFFTDGMVLGSEAFVNGIFERFRDRFSRRRRTGARKIRLGPSFPLEGLRSARDLKINVLG